MTAPPPIRLAMIGGGPGAFIGPVHRMAARLDGRFELVAGCFSRDAAQSRLRADEWRIAPERAYGSHSALLAGEAARGDGAEAVAIVTPNASHFEIASAALAAGLHVMVEKPMATRSDDARALAKAAEAAGRQLAVAFTYMGYPALRAARVLIEDGAIGAVRKIAVDYPQGWLSAPIEHTGNRQASWRLDAAEAGPGGCIADIGIHAFTLAETLSGLQVGELCADLSSVVPGRTLDDNADILLRFHGGARGVMQVSQIATGEENALSIRLWGENGGLAWTHAACDRIRLRRADGRVETIGYSDRLPPGHPEGFIEAFATLYRDFADAIQGSNPLPPGLGPGAGVRAAAFVEAARASSERRGWVEFPQ